MPPREVYINGEAPLIRRTDVQERILVAEAKYTLDDVVARMERRGIKYFNVIQAIKHYLSKIIPKIKSEKVIVTKKWVIYRPYWVAAALYGCRYIRKHTHKLKIESDVEAIMIHGHKLQIITHPVKISDVLSALAAKITNFSYGPAKISSSLVQRLVKAGVSRVLSSRDLTIAEERELAIEGIEEQVSAYYQAMLCFDANTGREDKEMFKALERVESLKPADIYELMKEGVCLNIMLTRDEVVDKLESAVVRPSEDTPYKILEQEFRVSRLELIYIPVYRLKLRREGSDIEIVVNVNGITGKVNVIK